MKLLVEMCFIMVCVRVGGRVLVVSVVKCGFVCRLVVYVSVCGLWFGGSVRFVV